MPDPLIASAFVRIKPEPKSVSGFGKEVRTAIEKSFLRPVRIKVDPTLLPFKKKIQTELSSAVFTIKVTPVLAPGFKAQVSKLAREAAATVTVPIKPSVPVGAAGAAKPAAAAVARGPALSTAATREAAFSKQLNDLALARAATVRKLTAAEQAEGSVKQKLTTVTSALSKAEGVLEKHLKTQDAIESSLTVKQRARLATAIRRAEADVAVAASAKAVLESTIAQSAADLKANAAAEARTAIQLRLADAQAALAAASGADELVTGTLAKAKARLAATSTAAAAAVKLHADAEALAAVAATDENIAVTKLTGALAEKAIADEVAAKTAVKTAIADNEAAAAAGTRTAREKQLAKGLLATALAAAGARGATLAAGFEFLAGAAIATGLFKSVQLASKLETELNVFKVTAGATADQMERVGAASRQLGADITLPSVSANDAAQAMTELAKAGLSVQDSIDAARGTLQLGTAAQIDNATAVNLTASALNAFGLAGTQAVHVADLLAGAARESQGTISDMGGALSSVASVARQAGVSVEDTIALLTLLTKNGIQGAESGTALRVALLRLIAPTEKAEKVLNKLGVTVLNSIGNVRPQIFADIARETDKLTASQRNQALQTIFGTRAIRAQAVLGREGVLGLEAMRDATNQAGLASEDAAARTKGFAGQVEALKNSMSTLGEEIGQALIPVFGNVIDAGLGTITVLKEMKKRLDDLGNSIPGGGGGGGGGFFDNLKDIAGLSFNDLIEQIQAANEELRKVPVSELAFGEGLTHGPVGLMNVLNERIAETVDNADLLATRLQKAAIAGGDQGAVKNLQKLRAQILGSGEEAERLRARIDAVIRLVTALSTTPTAIELQVLFEKGGVDKEIVEAQRIAAQTKINIDLGLNKKSVVFLGSEAKDAAADASRRAAEQFKLMFGRDMTPAERFIWDPFYSLAPEVAEEKGRESAKSFKVGFDDEMAIAEASGASLGSRLATARAAAAKSQRFFDRIQAEIASGQRPKGDPLLGKAAAELNKRNAAIDSLTGEITQNSKQASQKIATARNEADQAFLDALGLRRGNLENAILRAEGRAGLDDDIKTQTALRNFFKKKIEEASKTIKDAQTKAETIQSLTADLISANQKLRELNRQLIDSLGQKFETRLNIAGIVGTVGSIRKIYAEWINALQKALAEATKGSKLAQELKLKILETQKAAFAAINEGFELDIQIAEAQERPAAEVRARERFIAQLRREQEQFRKGSLEWKRLQLEIVNQQKAVDEARKANDDLNNAFAKMAFSFLTTQQGFAATLLGNLLPIGAIGNTVGAKLAGSSPSSSTAVAAAGNFVSSRDSGDAQRARERLRGGGIGGPAASSIGAHADAVAGPTRGQQTIVVDLLRQILQVLRHQHAASKHPENKRSQQQNRAAMDGQGN